MSTAPQHQRLPAAGPEREALREKGQFWTPDWVADAMVAYVLGNGSDHLFDPAVGGGAFFLAARRLGQECGRSVALRGTELHADALAEARSSGLSEQDLQQVQIADFVLSPPERTYRAIVANPPYIRHHRLSAETKLRVKRFGHELLGEPLDGRAGLHVYFLLRALQRLAPGGRLAFIMPADSCEGVFARRLWEWITQHFRLDAVITFAPEASPFPGVDTNALVFLIRKSGLHPEFAWVSCRERGPALREWIASSLPADPPAALTVVSRTLAEGLETGLSRAPRVHAGDQVMLGEFAKVLRGIATGANEFFFLTRSRAAELGIPGEFLLPAIGRTRDVPGELITQDTLDDLDRRGRPTLLFSPDGRPIEQFPAAVAQYLRAGKASGLPERPLISTRRPWYRMEVRTPPAFLFAYLGRRKVRFIRNLCGVVPLTCLLCVYPRETEAEQVARLWEVLRHPETIRNLEQVGKSYGGGAIKVEPRGLERLGLPLHVLRSAGLGGEGGGGEREAQLSCL